MVHCTLYQLIWAVLKAKDTIYLVKNINFSTNKTRLNFRIDVINQLKAVLKKAKIPAKFVKAVYKEHN